MKTPRFSLITSFLGLLATAGISQAAVTLTGTSTFNAGSSRYLYEYSVTNAGTAEEIIQVSFPVSATAALLGLTAPTGFAITYDMVGARVNFIWDSNDFTPQTFAPNSTVPGFSFTSAVAPGVTPFTADDVNQQYTGFTSAPIPEPSGALLALLPLGVLLRRRR